jgi:hypothetical protein
MGMNCLSLGSCAGRSLRLIRGWTDGRTVGSHQRVIHTLEERVVVYICKCSSSTTYLKKWGIDDCSDVTY